MKKRSGEEKGMRQRSWVATPPKVRMGTTSIVCRSPGILFFGIFCLFFLLFFYSYLFPKKSTEDAHTSSVTRSQYYNHTYPISPSFHSHDGDIRYRIGIIADLDTNSKNGSDSWRSFFKSGYLTQIGIGKYGVKFDEDFTEVRSKLNYGGRGMELSELVVFNGGLYSCDDRTGVIYKLSITSKGVQPIAWVILPDGNGNEVKGFKCEWMTVKDEYLFVGGLGKEWTTPNGVVLNHNPMYIKKISMNGEVEHIKWVDEYLAVRGAAGITAPGYMIHEAVEWSPVHEKWFFLPRRASKDKYDDVVDEVKGTNFLLKMNSNDLGIEVLRVGRSEKIEFPSHGFSSFKFIPGSRDRHILALKSEEYKGSITSYITVIDYEGNILMPETKIGNYKFEGIEFI
ncbi:CANT1 [Lepeophtheirus salmonis]|uniref:Apyrase n=1 Tax=Lepeophtheirus salmonis TaxID=72036 RepID=A0A0K2UD51_LEPSM|nr:CANT1 [Lepeophtheirus salmonis]CAF2759836.1 CANT1 [Lepeophtheirus salmonis]